MSKIYRVTVKGTGQLNGPVIIYKVIDFEDHRMASRMTGSKRYEVLAEWVKVHYPGVKVNPRSLGVNLTVIKKPRSTTDLGKSGSIGSVLAGMAIGAIANAFSNNSSEDNYEEEEPEPKKKIPKGKRKKSTTEKIFRWFLEA